MSAGGPLYSVLFTISGAMYEGVPQKISVGYASVMTVADAFDNLFEYAFCFLFVESAVSLAL